MLCRLGRLGGHDVPDTTDLGINVGPLGPLGVHAGPLQADLGGHMCRLGRHVRPRDVDLRDMLQILEPTQRLWLKCHACQQKIGHMRRPGSHAC